MAQTSDKTTSQDTFWEQAATTQWGRYLTEIERRHIVRASQLAEAPTLACEIGCDGGRWSKLLADMGWQLVCTDINQHSLDVCQQRIPTAECLLVQPDDTTIPCQTETIQLLLCIEVEVIHHDWFIAEAHRVLKLGGVMVAVAWNLFSLRSLYVRLASLLSANQVDPYKIPYLVFRRRLRQHGFAMLAEEGYCWFPFSRESNSSLVPAAVQLEKWLGLRRLPVLSPWVVHIARKTR